MNTYNALAQTLGAGTLAMSFAHAVSNRAGKINFESNLARHRIEMQWIIS
jgi:hypothetical protein